ncbi:MAG TPA: hypothetical protein VJ891_17385 [Casimicrobiaceae bacterium]|nr:hypothetical protein [Casimicrobiaceae bacterium]
MIDAHEIGELIAFGLNPRLSPARDARYAELVSKFRTNGDFRQQVESVADGQGLDILDCSPLYGLVLTSSDSDSPYHMPIDQYSKMSNTEERHLNALIFLTIATACFPNAESLDAEDGPLPNVTVAQIVRFLNGIAERIKERSITTDPPMDQPQLEPVYRLVLRWREGDTTGDDRSNPKVKTGMVRRALKFLAATGLADELSTPKDTFRIRSRFRLHVRDAASVLGESLAHFRDLGKGVQ